MREGSEIGRGREEKGNMEERSKKKKWMGEGEEEWRRGKEGRGGSVIDKLYIDELFLRRSVEKFPNLHI